VKGEENEIIFLFNLGISKHLKTGQVNNISRCNVRAIFLVIVKKIMQKAKHNKTVFVVVWQATGWGWVQDRKRKCPCKDRGKYLAACQGTGLDSYQKKSLLAQPAY
jgi:hypothetical protein